MNKRLLSKDFVRTVTSQNVEPEIITIGPPAEKPRIAAILPELNASIQEAILADLSTRERQPKH
jgi:hypothetical protein